MSAYRGGGGGAYTRLPNLSFWFLGLAVGLGVSLPPFGTEGVCFCVGCGGGFCGRLARLLTVLQYLESENMSFRTDSLLDLLKVLHEGHEGER